MPVGAMPIARRRRVRIHHMCAREPSHQHKVVPCEKSARFPGDMPAMALVNLLSSHTRPSCGDHVLTARCPSVNLFAPAACIPACACLGVAGPAAPWKGWT